MLELDDEIDPEVLTSFVKKVEPQEQEKPVWTTIDPFLCYFCKKENRYERYDIFEGKDMPIKVPIYSNFTLCCKYCHTPNIVIDPYDYKIIKETQYMGNLSSLIY